VTRVEKQGKIILVVAIIVIAGAVAGGGAYIYVTDHPGTVTLDVSIASSLTNVAEYMAPTFDQQHNCQINFNIGGSSALESQIASGFPCQVFMSANPKWTSVLNSSNDIYDNNVSSFCTNTLIVILPKDNPKNITTLLQLAQPGIRIDVCNFTVPAGEYTQDFLNNVNSTWGNSSSSAYIPAYAGYANTFMNNIKSYELTDEAVVSNIVNDVGNYDAAIAYVSDAIFDFGLFQTIPINATVNQIGTYAMGITTVNHISTAQLAVAYDFVDFWLTASGQTLLRSFGFGNLTATFV